MTTRAIHLEIAYTLDASSTIMAIRRLGSMRGYPVHMYSDNGTNFVKSSKELKDAIVDIDKKSLSSFAEKKYFTWHFNPPDAPHMGGAWERLIRSVKIALYHSLNDEAPTQEVLSTLFAEITHMVNSRPLTHVSVDPRDEEALTPNHFLIGSSSGNLRLERYESEVFTPRKRFEIAQHYANCFWRRWLQEYLPTLIPRRKWHTEQPSLKVGDIVMIIDYQAPRNIWKKGKISALFPGSDGIVRVAKINTGKSEFTRPVHELIEIFGIDEVEN